MQWGKWENNREMMQVNSVLLIQPKWQPNMLSRVRVEVWGGRGGGLTEDSGGGRTQIGANRLLKMIVSRICFVLSCVRRSLWAPKAGKIVFWGRVLILVSFDALLVPMFFLENMGIEGGKGKKCRPIIFQTLVISSRLRFINCRFLIIVTIVNPTFSWFLSSRNFITFIMPSHF